MEEGRYTRGNPQAVCVLDLSWPVRKVQGMFGVGPFCLSAETPNGWRGAYPALWPSEAPSSISKYRALELCSYADFSQDSCSRPWKVLVKHYQFGSYRCRTSVGPCCGANVLRRVHFSAAHSNIRLRAIFTESSTMGWRARTIAFSCALCLAGGIA
jgi:hypothetical protein